MTEKKVRSTEMERNEQAAALLKQEFFVLPDSVATQIMQASAEKNLRLAEKGRKKWEDALFWAGVSLAHALCHNGMMPSAEKINGGWYVSNKYGWNKKGFAEMAIPAYVAGMKRAKATIPKGIQAVAGGLYPAWFKEEFGVAFSKEVLGFLLNLRPIVMPFDHFTNERSFVGGRLHYPAGYWRPGFNYMKALGPPWSTMWYSDRQENDCEKYARMRARNRGLAIKKVIEEIGFHECAHILSIIPAVALAMKGEIHCWLSEGVAIALGPRETVKSELKKIDKIPPIETIADTADKSVDYRASLLLTMGLGAELSGSVEEIPKGIELIVKRVAEKAEQVVSGRSSKLECPLALLYWIDPALRSEKEKEELAKLMEAVKKHY